MPTCCSAQILSDSLKRRISEPFTESMHYKQCSGITSNVILKGNVPCKVPQCNLSDSCSPFDTNVCLRERLLVGDKIADALTKLEYLCFFKIQILERVFCVFHYGLKFRFIGFFFSLHILLLLVLIFLVKQFHSLFLDISIIKIRGVVGRLNFHRYTLMTRNLSVESGQTKN